MRGCLQRARVKDKKTGTYVERDKHGLSKGHHSFNIILSMGRGENGKYKQRWVRFHGTRKQAEAKLTELTGQFDKGELIEPSKITVGQYFDEWMLARVKPHSRATYKLYKAVVENHLKPAFGHIPLQQLTKLHIQRYFAELKPMANRTKNGTFSDASKVCHHRILSAALNAAVESELLQKNVARKFLNKPKLHSNGDVSKNVWAIDETRKFLTTVKAQEGAQWTALFALLLDSGMRKSEVLGLQWGDLHGKQLKIERQLLQCGFKEPVYSLPKRGRIRTIELSDETIALLKEHKRQQSELKMANRNHYRDLGLMFAQSWEDLRAKRVELGSGIAGWSVNRKLKSLCAAAKVKAITVHGLRHTSATLLLAAGIPPNVVQRRLGHEKVELTLNLYAHVLPSMQTDAASRLAVLLHG